MKKFTFQLEKLLNYKNQVLGSEMMVLAELNAELSEAYQELEEIKNKIQESIEVFDAKIRENNSTPITFQIHKTYLEAIRQKREIKSLEIAQIEIEIEKQRETIKKAKIETKSIEKIKEIKYDDYKKECQKKFEQEIEEFVSTSRVINELSK